MKPFRHSDYNHCGSQVKSTLAVSLAMFLYYSFICALGLTLLVTLVYGLTLSNDTISNNMLIFTPYHIVLSTCIFLQIGVWTLCLYSKRAMDPGAAIWGFITMGIVTCSWVGLSTILTGTPHVIFVCIFMASFIINILIMCNLTWQEDAGKVLRTSVAFVIVCVVAMIILFNKGEFYIMEHVAFISYSLVFLVFFIVHTPSQWDVLPDTLQAELECENEVEWHYRNQRGITC
jgi:hypothetical protein